MSTRNAPRITRKEGLRCPLTALRTTSTCTGPAGIATRNPIRKTRVKSIESFILKNSLEDQSDLKQTAAAMSSLILFSAPGLMAHTDIGTIQDIVSGCEYLNSSVRAPSVHSFRQRPQPKHLSGSIVETSLPQFILELIALN